MTVIVGLECDDCVYIGGDSAATSQPDLDSTITTNSKVFYNGNLLFGFSSSFRIGQLLRYSLKILPMKKGMNEIEYLVTHVADRIRKLCNDKGTLKKDNDGGDDYIDSKILCCVNGKLFSIEPDLGIVKSAFGYDAVGCGSNYALGAMYATKNLNMSPEQRIKIALESACIHNASCRAPFTILKQEKTVSPKVSKAIKK